MLEPQRRLDRREPRVSVGLGAESNEVAAGVVGTADLDQPAGRLESGQDGEREENADAGGDRKHGSPPLGAGQRLVDEISDKDADRDRELIARDELPALRGRSELRRIERGRDRGDADAEAGRQPAEHEHRNVRRKRLDRRADDEQRRGGEERALAPEMVGDIAAGERSEHGPERDPAGDDLERHGADRKGLLDTEKSARNDALVIAEQGAGEQDDRDDARSARERKSIGDRIGEFRARTGAGTA